MNQPKSVVNAAVAVLRRADGMVLIGQRPPGKPWEGWWEFPGGKIEQGETAIQALKREAEEELGIVVTEAYPWLHRVFDYPERRVCLNFFMVHGWLGEPHGRENQQLVWQHPHSMTVGPMLPANEPILKALCLPDVYAITNLAESGEARFFAQLDAALANGLKLIQMREKHLSPDALEVFARDVTRRAHRAGAKVLVNADVALASRVGADGVHLPARALMDLKARPDLPLCAASCHDAHELAHAQALGLDFAVLSPVLPTLSHPEAIPLGWQGFAALCAANTLPVYALGGLQQGDLSTAWQHGAHGIAMQRSVWESP
jgi:8-oxo-dGTP diphosphatase